MRTHFIDPDFNKQTSVFGSCCVCGRAVGFRARKVFLCVDGFADVVHPEDATTENSVTAVVGADCAKKIPSEFSA